MTREQFIVQVKGTQEMFRRFLVALCCGDTRLADDVAQESYIKAYIHSGSIGNEEKFKAWLYRIGYNTFLNFRRGERFNVDYANVQDDTATVRADNAFDYQELYVALNTLSANERTAVLLFYMENYSIKEIAQIQDTTEDAVKKRLSRGRANLRGLLS